VILFAAVAATVAGAALCSGRRRWGILAIGPAVGLAVAVASVVLVVRVIQPGEGSGFLLGGAAIGLYGAALAVYYPLLAGVGLVRGRRRRASQDGEAAWQEPTS